MKLKQEIEKKVLLAIYDILHPVVIDIVVTKENLKEREDKAIHLYRTDVLFHNQVCGLVCGLCKLIDKRSLEEEVSCYE